MKAHDIPLPLRLNQPDTWLLAYDIRAPKRLQRMQRIARKNGIPLQKSLFLLVGSRAKIDDFVDTLRNANAFDAKIDDVRIYPLTRDTPFWPLGCQQTLTIDTIALSKPDGESDEQDA